MRKQIITVSREFGSGGRSVGHRVAELLNVPYYDKELVKQVAVETGFDEKFIEHEGEYASPWQSLLSYAFAGNGSRQHMNGLSTADFLWVMQCRVIMDLAEKGPCVIVGRCADYILRDRPGLVRIFITADLDARIARVSKRDGLDPKAAEEKIRRMDKTRASYYSFHTDRKWGAAECFDMCLSSSFLGVDKAAELILKLCEGMEK